MTESNRSTQPASEALPASGHAMPGPDPTAEWTRQYLAALAQVTGGLSPLPFGGAWMNWWSRLAQSPSKQTELAQSAMEKTMELWGFAAQAADGNPHAPVTDNPAEAQRFKAGAWGRWPYNVLAQSYLHTQAWWDQAADAAPGMDKDKSDLARFSIKQALEAVSPQNFLLTNPELLDQTAEENGRNLQRGFENWLEDLKRTIDPGSVGDSGTFKVGEQVAISPGKVVFRNNLIELIQYSPATPDVYAEPILIVPAWIMKYYILDLSPANSLVRYLVEQGHTVFMISWKNPAATDRALAMDDYVSLGVGDALDVVAAVCPRKKVHAVGYCIGGTLLSIAAARLANAGDKRIGSVTLLAAQTDFSEPGELSLFINPDQLAMLEAKMSQSGVLEAKNMSGAFALLRSRDLIWNPMVSTYLQGQRAKTNDLMSWNADGTRMAHRMHTDYLFQLYLNNDLAGGRYCSHGELVDLKAIAVPMFVVGTETDHVAPWKSVYKVRDLTRSRDYSFLLTSGGHNAGIISGRVHPRRHYRLHRFTSEEAQLGADGFVASTEKQPGSWWPVWQQWLVDHSNAKRVAPPAMGAPEEGFFPVTDAPGSYVLQR
jgi:polyhydroxyalkanoate synthase